MLTFIIKGSQVTMDAGVLVGLLVLVGVGGAFIGSGNSGPGATSTVANCITIVPTAQSLNQKLQTGGTLTADEITQIALLTEQASTCGSTIKQTIQQIAPQLSIKAGSSTNLTPISPGVIPSTPTISPVSPTASPSPSPVTSAPRPGFPDTAAPKAMSGYPSPSHSFNVGSLKPIEVGH